MPHHTPLIHTIAQVKAVSGPTQHRLLAALERLGNCSVAELSEAAGLPPESIYYHIRNFERVGIVIRTGERATSRRAESTFQLRSNVVDFDSRNQSPSFRRALGKMVGALMRMASRAYESAMERGDIRHSGRYRNANMHQLFLRIPKSRRAEAHHLIDELFASLQQFDDESEEQWTTITLLACPLDE